MMDNVTPELPYGCHIDFTKATFVVFPTSILSLHCVELVNNDVTQNMNFERKTLGRGG